MRLRMMMLAFCVSGCAAKTTVTHHPNGVVEYDSTGPGSAQANREAMAHDSSLSLAQETGNVSMRVDQSGLSVQAGQPVFNPAVNNGGWTVVPQGVAPAAPLPTDLWSTPQPVYPSDTPVGSVQCPKSKDWGEMTVEQQLACLKLETDYLFEATDN